MSPTPSKLQLWREAATLAERTALAEKSGCTPESLRQMAKAYRTNGRLRITPGIARAIALATEALARPGLDPLRREDLSPECAQCEYAKTIQLQRTTK
jgi:DNA-binding transcriptional regulator YdaS (Cro superfamily)